MAALPVEPGPAQDVPQPGTPNPTRLPVEPEFGPAVPPAEPEQPLPTPALP